jgi:excisionase family DNA binding protein
MTDFDHIPDRDVDPDGLGPAGRALLAAYGMAPSPAAARPASAPVPIPAGGEDKPRPQRRERDRDKGPPAPDRAMTVRQVAAEYGVTPKTIYQWVKGGALRSIQLPAGDLRFRRHHLDEFDQCRDRGLPNPTTDSVVEETSGSPNTPIPFPGTRDPFRRGQATATTRKSGWTDT